MPFEHGLPLNRQEVRLDAAQETACDRAERGHALSDVQQGCLHAAATFASPDDARRAQNALDVDREKRGGRA